MEELGSDDEEPAAEEDPGEGSGSDAETQAHALGEAIGKARSRGPPVSPVPSSWVNVECERCRETIGRYRWNSTAINGERYEAEVKHDGGFGGPGFTKSRLTKFNDALDAVLGAVKGSHQCSR